MQNLIAVLFLTLLIVACGSPPEITDTPGYIYTIAGGSRASRDAGDGGVARNAKFSRVGDLAVGGSFLYIATADRVRRIDLETMVVETFAGGGDAIPVPGMNALGTSLGFRPEMIAVDGDGNLWLIYALPHDDERRRSISMLMVIDGASGVVERVLEVPTAGGFAVGREGTAYWVRGSEPSTMWMLGLSYGAPRAAFEYPMLRELAVDRTGKVLAAAVETGYYDTLLPGRILSVDPRRGSAEIVAGPFDGTPSNPIYANDPSPSLGEYRSKFSPDKLAIGPDNNLYYAQADGVG